MVRLRTVFLIPAALLAALMIVACGDDDASGNGDDPSGEATPTEAPADDTPAPADDDEAAPADDDEAAPDPESANGNVPEGAAVSTVMEGAVTGDMGTVTVNGEPYPMTEAVRCEPSDVGGFEFDLEMQARNLSGDAQGHIYIYLGGIMEMDVHWLESAGVFSDPEGGEVDWSDGRVSGSGVLSDTRGGDESVEISFDLVVPEAEIDCG